MSADLRAPHVDLVSRQLRIALMALEQMALPSPGASNGESIEVMARRKAAQTALDRIGALR
jgi:hypothetical protein